MREWVCGLLFAMAIAPAASGAPLFTITDLGAVFGRDVDSMAQAINDAGVVVGGRFSVQTNGRAVRWNTDGTHTILPPPPNFDHSGATDINAQGQITGNINSNGFFGAIWNPDGSIVQLNIPGSRTAPQEINDHGQVVGTFGTDNTGQRDHGFLWQDNSYIDLGTLGGRNSFAYSINNAGVVVGSSESANLNTRAFVWQDANHNNLADPGEMSQLPDLGLSSSAYHIDDQGVVAGFVLRPNFTRRPTLWKNGVPIPLPNLAGFLDCEVWSTNSSGWAVGDSSRTSGLRATLWADGSVYNLDQLIPRNAVWDHLNWAFDVNESGSIVGFGHHVNDSTEYAFLLTPVNPLTPPGAVPLPAAIWAGGAPGIFLLTCRRRLAGRGRRGR